MDQVYRDNDLMKKELKNMDVLMEENLDLKEEVDKLKSMNDDAKFAQIGEENSTLRKRNGALLIENAKLKEDLEKLKKEAPL